MYQLSQCRQCGVTLIELMVGLGIVGFTLAVGVPSMSHWMSTNKARAASEFYGEGLALARREAVSHNARSRIVFSQNTANNQYNWQVDLCFPQVGTACSDTSGTWSTVGLAAAGDPEGVQGFKSVFRSGEALPPTSVLKPTLEPAGASAVYFTEVGWVDTTLDNRVNRLRLDPDPSFKDDVPAVAMVVTLSGMVAKCDPTRSAGDSRACPP